MYVSVKLSHSSHHTGKYFVDDVMPTAVDHVFLTNLSLLVTYYDNLPFLFILPVFSN